MFKRHPRNPILTAHPTNDWENLAVCNPGVWKENDTFYMLYRAAGDDVDHVIRFGLATSKNGIDFERVSDLPAFSPSQEGPDAGCVEDPRIVKFGDFFYVTYAFRPTPPGRYWTFPHDVVTTADVDEYAPLHIRENIANSALAMTRDFKKWIRLGRITNPSLDDRDVILFPEKIKGRYALLHRPKEWIGAEYGTDYPAIWLRFSDDLLQWTEPSHLLLAGRSGKWDQKIGGSAPPLRTDAGWLVIYHGVDLQGLGTYRVGAALLDLDDPTRVIARSEDPILEPEADYELNGMYAGCVFPTGNVIDGDTLYVYYGAADQSIGVATAKLSELLEHLSRQAIAEAVDAG